ncbi:SecDF P1 head subdomain-containing protein [Enterobacter quasiroggenkampii]|uniref:SecDF P1 head subdomain-containing protein n=1 Tax=Enterobacter quasiroggenkampii TaxID=2497436 RepID=UPI0021D07A01|nr:Insecticidal toxin complex protein tccz [Enterobacter quasiroggenkampii]MCU6383749.1 Insecticidal toxin complex protein tccz [Enterobacter quasiroggenkampii]MCU6393414.1 Insecticidal toxin complex protein tccz [Enterobacter quasiroggenkampii]MCU6402055.1 Insecticidal toxin complex protein tccz [Enterobacter quasiroggenkampii]MCU6416048.1 Insecticidal toxin complex protein tccz [Enterobacter quasiroggenkampii]
MQIKFGVLLLVVLVPLTSTAAKGSFVFSVGNEKTSFDSGCVKSIDYVEKDETGAENLVFRFSDECGKRLSDMTRQNIGKHMTIAYDDNKITSAMIASRLSNSFRISTKDIPRIILMQILNDYDGVRDQPEKSGK